MIMKKHITTLLSILVLSTSTFAQFYQRTSVDWNGIKLDENSVIGIAFEIKEANFGGLSFSDRCDVDPELETEWPDAVTRCVNSANQYMNRLYGQYVPYGQTAHSIHYTTKTEGKSYVIVVKVLSVASDGWTIADATFTTPYGVATFTNLVGKGGRFGSFVNLMGDGFESIGEELAKRIYKAKERKKI